MSNLGLQVVGQLDPHLADPVAPVYTVPIGAKQSTAQQISANTWPQQAITTTTQIGFNCPPASPDTYVDNCVTMFWDVTLNFTGTNTKNTSTLLLLGSDDGLRAFPISSAVGNQSITVTINNEQITQQMDCLTALLNYVETHEPRNRKLSVAPCMPDSFPNYGDWRTWGSAQNPLATWGENAYDTPRGAFQPYAQTQTTTTASLSYRIQEPFWLSPLEQYKITQSFVGIQNMSFTINISNIARMWSHDPTTGNTLSTLSVTFNSAPQLRFMYKSAYNYVPGPRMYPFNDIAIRNPVNIGNVAPNATVNNFLMSTFTVDIVPRKCFIFARPDNSVLTNGIAGANFTDTFLNITKVNMQWGTQSGIFSSYTEHDLYFMALECGLACSWIEWKYLQGSVLAFIPGIHFPLPDETDAPGSMKQTQVTIQITYNAINPTQTINYTSYFVGITAGAIVIDHMQAQRTNAPLGPGDVARVRSGAGPKMIMNMSERLNGMGFWDNLKAWVDKGLNYGSKALGFASSIAPQLGAASSALSGLHKAAFGGRMFGRGLIDDSKDAQMSEMKPAPRALSHKPSAPPRRLLAPPRKKQREESHDDVLMLPEPE